MSAAENKAVFLSYASQDAEAARRLCEALRAGGVEVWFDADGGLEHGDEWDAKIRRQIKECVLFIPVISASTQARHEGYFRIEWELAAQRAMGIASGVPFILPVVIDDTREPDALVPDRFRMVQWTKLRGGEVPPDVQQRFLKLWSHRTGVLKHEDAKADRPVGEAAPVALSPPASAPAPSPPRHKASRAWLTPTAIAFAVAALAAGFVFTARRDARQREQLTAALENIDRGIAAHDVVGAFALAEQVERDSPGESALNQRWEQIAVSCSIDTTPTGAEIWAKPYARPQSAWRRLGTTPLHDVRLPRVYTRWRIEKAGSAPREIVAAVGATIKFTLDPADAVPAGMVRVPAGTTASNSTGLPSVRLAEFFIDRCEVTNRQFKEFVDQGGYVNAEFWRQPFAKSGRTVSREEALAGFRDSTGRPGPAGWKNGTYAEGAGDLPVTGVSWFEAAAFAEWAGKRLPSVFHWRQAARLADDESLVPLSNFSGKGLAAAGTYQGISACGAYDMAGNAKEWCWNAAGDDVRYLLGGAWREPDYMFVQDDAATPFDRAEVNGFRCIKLVGASPLPAQVDAVRVPEVRDYTNERPVNDETFRAFRSFYSYDKGPVEARMESVDDTDPRWRKERVSYRAAYGDERIGALVFLPKNATPPYLPIVFFPGAGSISTRSSEALRDLNIVSVLVASGRALIYPIYKGTYERGAPGLRAALAPAADRDWLVMLAKDVGRTIDYLETRPDVQAAKVAYASNSWGSALGPFFGALDNRIKVNVFIIGGFFPWQPLPEADQINFAPHNTAPTLMVSGRYDFRFPLEASQRPMFKWLGAPPEQKRHVLFDTGHALKAEQIASVAYAWLDQYQGLVK